MDQIAKNPTDPSRLLEALSNKFQVEWIAPAKRAYRLSLDIDWAQNPTLIGYFNAHRPTVIQVLERSEFDQLLKLESKPEVLASVLNQRTFALIFCDNLNPPRFLLDWCQKESVEIPLMKVDGNAQSVINYLYGDFTKENAPTTTMHGVFLQIYGVGVMISGVAGIGKSEVCLELISRGHQFIADDSVKIVRTREDALTGSCTDILRDMLEVRSLGILNVARMYGNHTVLNEAELNLIIALINDGDHTINNNRLRPLELEPTKILDVSIPVFPIQVRPGRNTCVLIEACVRSFLLKSEHRYDAVQEIVERRENDRRARQEISEGKSN